MTGVLVVGDITVDLLARVETFTALGGDHLAEKLEQHCGGVGANTALALARWDVPVRLLGCVGGDWLGDFALHCLQSGGVDISLVQRSDQSPTGLMFIAISPDGQRTIFGARGANAQLLPPEVDGSYWGGIVGVHLMGYNFLSRSAAETAGRLLEEARRRGVWVSLDVGMAPSQQIPRVILNVAKEVDVLFAGLGEARALTGQSDKRDTLAALGQLGVPEIAVKLGEDGCLFLEKGEWQEVPALAVLAVDTTGSGDAFAAALLRARLHRWPRATAALLANAAGAAAASVLGAGEQMPGPQEILRLLGSARLTPPWEPVRMQALELLREEMKLAGAAGFLGD